MTPMSINHSDAPGRNARPARGDQPAPGRDRFGRELKRWRERAGLTQVQLAGRLGYDNTHLSKIENGDRLPHIDLASRADNLLCADGALLAAATSVLARRGPRGGDQAGCGTAATPLPVPGAAAGGWPARPRRLPALGVTCPLHGSDGCWVVPPAAGLPGLRDNLAREGTVDADAIHGFAALLVSYIEACVQRTATDLAASVERTARALMRLVPSARGRAAVGLLNLAARYAELAGWLRVEQGQHGIGMMWLQQAVEWGRSSGSLAVVCESLGRMSTVARLEGDGATAVAYGQACAAVAPRRCWALVESKLYEARGQAVLGDRRECERQASEAQRAAERLGKQDLVEAPWLFGAEGEAFIASHLSGALRDLADVTADRAIAGHALRFAETSLASLPRTMYPSRLLLTLRVADSYACRGEPDAAVAVARPVIAEAASAGTTLIQRELGRLRARLGSCGSELASTDVDGVDGAADTGQLSDAGP